MPLPEHIIALVEHYPAMRQVPHRNLTSGMTDGQSELSDLEACVRKYERLVVWRLGPCA